jgi:hypothetical protein
MREGLQRSTFSVENSICLASLRLPDQGNAPPNSNHLGMEIMWWLSSDSRARRTKNPMPVQASDFHFLRSEVAKEGSVDRH